MNQIAAQLRESAIRQRAGAPEGAAVPVADELDQAAAEIEKLEEAICRLAEQDATLSLLMERNGGVTITVTMDATLTDAERAAIDWAAYAAEQWYEHTAAATLRGLLERTK